MLSSRLFVDGNIFAYYSNYYWLPLLSYTLLQELGGNFHATLTSHLKTTRGSASVRSTDHHKPLIGLPSHLMRGVPGLGLNPIIRTPRLAISFARGRCIVTNTLPGSQPLITTRAHAVDASKVSRMLFATVHRPYMAG